MAGIAAVAERVVVGKAAPGVAPSCYYHQSPPRRSSLGQEFLLLSKKSRYGRGGSAWSGAFPRAMGSSASSPQTPDGRLQEASKADYASFSDDEWKKRLTKEQYCITRQKGTERAFTGEYWNTKTLGTYHCICCDASLFESTTKFDSGTGWPSYHSPIENNVKSKLDLSIIFMPRQEVLCAVCEAHLGHVFNDGPPPTGKRYCINR
uniref:Peptide-methionine (R)-S-oxide reductase n=1 Tax=Anthurium amnicola TaxID=1678845 RepID=A0A1D1XQH3_9ARAE